MSPTPNEIALQHLERLKVQLRKDLDLIEEDLAEFESDSVVKRNRISELSMSHRELADRIKEIAGSSMETSKDGTDKGCIEGQDGLGKILAKIESEVNELGQKDRWSETYSNFRNRLIQTINTIDLVLVAQRKNIEMLEKKAQNEARLQAEEGPVSGARTTLGTSAIIRSQELERQRIAREIHDGPAQAIANVVLRMDILAKIYEKDPERVPDELANMKRIAQGALDEIRGFIFDLRPMTLQDLGLVATIKRVITSLKDQMGLDVRFVVEGEERQLGQLINLAVFRIAQESLTNIRKYAQCGTAWVHLKYLEDKVILIVEDDGIGFDIDRVAEGHKQYASFGQLGMQERADDINGNLEITSATGEGTRLVLVVPTENNPAVMEDVDGHRVVQ